jgi:Cof subfamily protein (haloacid dehalogenase superfamily)
VYAEAEFGHRPRVAFFDIDGTIIGSSGTLSRPLISAIDALRRKGVEIALATGRPSFGARDVIEALAVKAPSMFFSGGLISRPLQGETVWVSGVESSGVRKIIDFCSQQQLYVEWYTADRYYIEHENDLTIRHQRYLHVPPSVVPFSSLASDQVCVKLVVVCRNGCQEALVRNFASTVPAVAVTVGVGGFDPDLRFVNITNPSAERGQVFDRLCALYRVQPEEVIAFGDAEADIAFLSRAGWGTAVGNASSLVQQAARAVCPPVDRDGVAVAVAEILERVEW